MRTGVLGLGLIGGSLLQGLAAAGREVVGADPDAGAVRRAGFAVADGPAALARACDVVVVCAPPRAVPVAVAAVLAADPDVVVADAASVKAPVLDGVRARVGAAGLDRFVGAHPLAGATAAGWAGADPALLREALWAVCPPRPDAPPEPLCALAAALDPLDARLVACDAAAHDAAVARTSHAPHLVAAALAGLTGDDPLAAALSGGAYRDMTRTATAPPGLWLEILAANRAAAGAGLRELIVALEALAAALERGDDAALVAAWSAAAAARARVDAARWRAPDWTPRAASGPAWEALLACGRAGIAFRRPHVEAGELRFEVGERP